MIGKEKQGRPRPGAAGSGLDLWSPRPRRWSLEQHSEAHSGNDSTSGKPRASAWVLRRRRASGPRPLGQ